MSPLEKASDLQVTHGIVWLPKGKRELHHYDLLGHSVGLCNCDIRAKVVAEISVRDFDTANVVHAPVGHEERAEEFWDPPRSPAERLLASCVRCQVHNPGIKVFLLRSNPSYEWSNVGREPGSLPDITNYIVCKNCLTDEEIAKILIPVALFVIETLLLRVQHEGTPAASQVGALLKIKSGNMDLAHRGREKALEALG